MLNERTSYLSRAGSNAGHITEGHDPWGLAELLPNEQVIALAF